MAIGPYTHRTSGTFIVNHQALSWFGHLFCHNTLPTRSPPIGWARKNAVLLKFDSKPLEAAFSALF